MSTTIPSTGSGRRERKKLQTRRALQEAALRLVVERGFDHVTVEDIADTADVSKRTFFNYFTSKEAAVIGADPEAPAAIRASLAKRPQDEPPLKTLQTVLGEMAAEYTGTRSDWMSRRDLIRSDPRLLTANMAQWSELERTLVETISARVGLDPERDLYPGLLVSAAVGAMRVAVMRWRAGEGALSDLIAQAFEMLATGLKAPPKS
jgi:AcrR family transcriptional regulator